MEPMVAGGAVVATDVDDVPYLVEGGMSDFLVLREDEETLVNRYY